MLIRPALLLFLAVAATPAGAQQVARGSDGKPDLQGIWTNGFATPLERPRNLGDKSFYTDEEVAAFEKGMRDRPGPAADPVADPIVWWERATKSVTSGRTSMVTDPPDGRIPPLTAKAQQKTAEVRAENRKHPDSGPEDRSLMERCIISPAGGPVPMLPGPYNNNYQFVQTPDYVIIVIEMIHDVRIIRMNGTHIAPSVSQLLGDSVGHWEGDALVAETTNFTGRTRFHGADENLHVIERFTRTSPESLLYQFTIDDPTAFTKPWTAEIPLAKSSGGMYEFACHEGNAAMANMLRTARLSEKGH